MDKYYTSPELADELISHFSGPLPKRIADFAIGDGALLKSAIKIWPNAYITGNDFDSSLRVSLSISMPNLNFYSIDFLDKQQQYEVFGKLPLEELFDLIVLNPPFSCSGNTKVETDFNGMLIKCSKAMAFISESTKFLSKHGQLLAIVPESSLFSQKDDLIRKNLANNFDMVDIGIPNSYGFKGCSVRVRLIKLVRKSVESGLERKANRPKRKIFRADNNYSVLLMRGSVPNSQKNSIPIGVPFVHTTNLKNNSVVCDKRTVELRRIVSGPAIFIPRVGRPSPKKISIHSEGNVVISDCIIAMKTVPEGNEYLLLQQLIDLWENFSSIYSGTCAPYTTINKLRDFIKENGHEVSVVSSMSL